MSRLNFSDVILKSSETEKKETINASDYNMQLYTPRSVNAPLILSPKHFLKR